MSNNTISFITFTDVHISDTNPQSRLGDYRGDIMDKLNQIKLVGKKLNVDFFLFGGDLYHLPAPTRTSHKLNIMLSEMFRSYSAPIYGVAGNHDLRYDSHDSLREQPLGVLTSNQVIKLVGEETIDKGDIKAVIIGSEFDENPEIKDLDNVDISPFDVSIRILHLYSTPSGGKLINQKLYSYTELSELNNDIYMLGHYHIDQGIKEIKSKKGKTQHFINVGALSRGTRSDDDIKREPKISYVIIKKTEEGIKIKAQAIKLKVKPSEEVFDLEEKKKEKERIEVANKFVSKLEEELSDITNSADNIEKEIEDKDVGKEIIDSVKDYLEKADLALKDIK